jgi:hypothetical protein
MCITVLSRTKERVLPFFGLLLLLVISPSELFLLWRESVWYCGTFRPHTCWLYIFLL